MDHAEKLKSKGVDTIACVSVNDPFVMKAWAQSLGSKDVVMLADWDASFSKAVGMDVDLSGASLGKRSKRYSLLVKDGVIVQENVEKSPAEYVFFAFRCSTYPPYHSYRTGLRLLVLTTS